MRHAKELKRSSPGKAAFFFAVMFATMVLSLCLPLRPTFSSVEKRDLAKFPTFSVQSLLDGSYFRGIDSWFSDTFPFRDFFFTVNDTVRKGYGVKTTEIHGTVGPADEIPDDFFTGE